MSKTTTEFRRIIYLRLVLIVIFSTVFTGFAMADIVYLQPSSEVDSAAFENFDNTCAFEIRIIEHRIDVAVLAPDQKIKQTHTRVTLAAHNPET